MRTKFTTKRMKEMRIIATTKELKEESTIKLTIETKKHWKATFPIYMASGEFYRMMSAVVYVCKIKAMNLVEARNKVNKGEVIKKKRRC